jgi:hypothetical protein
LSPHENCSSVDASNRARLDLDVGFPFKCGEYLRAITTHDLTQGDHCIYVNHQDCDSDSCDYRVYLLDVQEGIIDHRFVFYHPDGRNPIDFVREITPKEWAHLPIRLSLCHFSDD